VLYIYFQIKQKALRSQEDRVARLAKYADTLANESGKTSITDDFNAFNTRWKNAFEKVGEYNSVILSLQCYT